jgi:hypothetical protein
LGGVILFFVGLFFFLLSLKSQRHFVALLFERSEARLTALRLFTAIEQNLAQYVAVVTVINLCVGLVTAAVAYLVGLPNPLLFGAAAFLFNYVPYLGPAAVVTLVFVVGLVVLPTLAQALLAPALIVAVNTLEGQFITPSVIGRQLTLSPLAIFLSIAFWTWLWDRSERFWLRRSFSSPQPFTSMSRASKNRALPTGIRRRSSPPLDWAIEKLSQLQREVALRIGFLNKIDIGIKPAVMNNGVSGVSGGVQNRQVRPTFAKQLRQLPAIERNGQNHVGEQQIESCPRANRADSLEAVGDGRDGIAQILKDGFRELPHFVTVFHDQDRFIAIRARHRFCRQRPGGGRRRHSRLQVARQI